ncbi:MAG: molybdopterin-dependent oxidoreductase [Nocardioidaceae bacterium]
MTIARRYGALAGIAAAGAGLGASELLSGLLHQRVSPLVAVSESVIGLTPGSVVEFVISIVGRNDKPLLIAATLVGLAIVSAVSGVVALRSRFAAEAILVAMGIVLVAAVHARLTPSTVTYVPAVIGVVVAMVTLAWLTPFAFNAAQRGSPRSAASNLRRSMPARRDFLLLAGSATLIAIVAGGAGRVFAQGRAAVEAARSKLRLPITKPTPPPGVNLGVAGVTPYITPQGSFYRIDTALSVPQILPTDWRLRIHGMVDREITVTYHDLVARGLTEAWVTLCCVSNIVGGDLISNARWSGVRIADVLKDAGIHGNADAVLATSSDGWTCGTPLGALTDDRNAMFAMAMNGEPLTPEHGFPVRMVVPGLYGYVSACKWVEDLNVTRFDDFSAFWTQRGWSPQGPVKTESRIDVPSNGQSVPAGQVAIGGVAWAQHTGISKVEVHVDDGPWQVASLGADPSIDTWRQWVHGWHATPGLHQIQVRATDATGRVQTSTVAGVLPNGATGWHTITVRVT